MIIVLSDNKDFAPNLDSLILHYKLYMSTAEQPFYNQYNPILKLSFSSLFCRVWWAVDTQKDPT